MLLENLGNINHGRRGGAILLCVIQYRNPWSNTGNIFLQPATQHFATLLRCKLKSVVVRITTHLKHCHATKNFVEASWSSMLQPVVAASWTGVYFFQQFFFNSQQQNFVAWLCLRWVVIRATTLFNLQRNDVALQVEEKRCPYYRAFTVIYLSVCKYVIKRCPNKVVTQLTTNMAADGFHFSGLHTTVSSTQSLSNTPKSPSEQTHRLCPPCCQRSTMLIRLWRPDILQTLHNDSSLCTR